MQKWEYYVAGFNVQAGEELVTKALNELGKKGWELVAVADAGDPDSSLHWQYCYFKREKS